MSDQYFASWPGGPPPPGYDPLAAMMGSMGRQPMFSDTGPRYTGPFNGGGAMSPMINMMMPALLQMLAGNSKVPTQFFPEQNVYDQMQANRYYAASHEAMSMAATRDTQSVEKMMNGMTQMMTGAPLTQVQTARNFRMARGLTKLTPMMTQFLGPDLVDQLYGSRGSATVFSQQLHHAMRMGIDPISHTPGYSGASAGRVSQEVFENLYGANADIGAMRGVSAGQAGILLNELQSRGMLGRPMGLLSVSEQRAMLPSSLSPEMTNRLAEQLPEIQKILKDGGTPNDKMLADARARIQQTHRQLRDPSIAITAKQLEEMPGAQDIIRAGDADRISQKLKNMAGAVKAMRDIFGDMGHPNAPMREILNGLEMLTQNSMAQMSAGDLESMVRRTHNIAKQTGIGVNNLMGMSAENGALADRLGLNRVFAVTAAQQGALFGAAAGDQLRLDMPTWNGLTKEQLTLSDQQLRMHAAASPFANQVNAVLRMSDSGMLQPGGNSELAAYLQAVKNGQGQYTFNGQNNSVIMPHGRMLQMLERDAGVSGTTAYAILNDIPGNQEAGHKYNTADLTRRVMPGEVVRKSIQPMLGNRFRGMFTDTGVDSLLRDAGVTGSDKDLRELSLRLGQSVGTDFFALDPSVANDPLAQRNALGQSLRNNLRREIAAKMPGRDEEEIDALVDQVMQKMGGNQWQSHTGTTIQATLNRVGAAHPLYKSANGMYRLNNKKTMDQAAARGRQAEMTTLMQTAMSGLGNAGPVQRLVDVMQNAGPNTKLSDVIAEALGAVDADAIAAADPAGPLAQILGLVQANNGLDATDPKHLEQARRNAALVQAIVNGGAEAAEQLKILDADPVNRGNAQLRRTLEAAAKGGPNSNMLGAMGYQLGANVTTDQVAATRDSGQHAVALLNDSKSTAAERADAINAFIAGSAARSQSLLSDTRSMEILGQGGLDLLQQTSAAGSKLQAMAEEQSKLLGKKITVADLLQGTNGVSAAVSKQANQLRETMSGNWDEIYSRRKFGMRPGEGHDPVNKNREAMTDQERSALASMQDFAAHHATPEERAAAVIDQMAALATPGQRQRMLVDTNRNELMKSLTAGDRSIDVQQALYSRNAILEMGLKKGIFGDKTKISELTDDEEQSAIKQLEKLDLSKAERADLARLRRHADRVMHFGDADVKESDIMADAQNIAKNAAPAAAAPLQQQTPELKVTVTGSVTQRDDGKLDLNLDGVGMLDQVGRLLGLR